MTGKHSNTQLLCCFYGIAINVHGGALCVADGKFIYLEIKHACLFIKNCRFLQFIVSSYLHECLEEHTQFVLLCHDHDIKQPVIQTGLWCNGKMIPELVAVGNTDKKRIGFEFTACSLHDKRI